MLEEYVLCGRNILNRDETSLQPYQWWLEIADILCYITEIFLKKKMRLKEYCVLGAVAT